MDRKHIAGLAIAAIIGGLIGAGIISWWNSPPARSEEDAALYDRCLISQHGNHGACAALMRTVERDRKQRAARDTATANLRDHTAKYLAAGFSKREIAEWALQNGYSSAVVRDVVGLPATEQHDLEVDLLQKKIKE
jgi:hypothetical protein